MRLAALVVTVMLMILASTATLAQSTGTQSSKPKPIQDNSFLVEEAYNQDDGEVQHTNTLTYSFTSRNWFYTFSQEWPLFGLKHQLSYSIPASGLGPTRRHRIGDIAINYRYQLTGNSESRLLIAPRFTVMLPTGASSRGLGSGGPSLQFNFPLTFVLTEKVVSHTNAGFTYARNGKNIRGDEASLEGYNFGQSLVWLVHPRFNLMLEGTWNRLDHVVARGIKEHETVIFVNPGFRWSYDLPSGLQIVPASHLPSALGRIVATVGIYLYLSFEHFFKH